MHFPEGRISSEEVRRCTDQPPLTHINTSSALSSSVTLHVLIQGPQSSPLPRDWNRHSGRLRHTWLRTVDSNLAPLNIDLATACRRAQNRQAWSTLVEMATSSTDRQAAR